MSEVLPKESSSSSSHTREENGIVYDVYKLIDLSVGLPVIKQNIHQLVDVLHDECWLDEAGGRITPHAVLEALAEAKNDPRIAGEAYPHLRSQINEIMDVDLAHPILIDSRSVVLDGVHRLARATLEHHATIGVKIVSDEMLAQAIYSKQQKNS